MSRIPKIKEIESTRLANAYGGWIYCEGCNKTIGYLCYVTYDSLRFSYKCNCGGCGSIHIAFENVDASNESTENLISIKNRLTCPADQSPLLTILNKNLKSCKYEVVCKKCNTKYRDEIIGGEEFLEKK